MHGPQLHPRAAPPLGAAGERAVALNSVAPIWRIAVVSLVVGFVLWQLVTKELAYYLALNSPETALLLDASQPLALAVLADRQLNGQEQDETSSGEEGADLRDPLSRWAAIAWRAIRPDVAPPGQLSAADRNRIKQMAETALLREPLNPRALRVLGQLADAAGDKQQAERYMRAAVRQSLRSTFAVHWLMVESAKAQDDAATLRYADLLLRKRPQLGNITFPLLAQIAEREPAGDRASLVAALANDPPWRTAFLRALPTAIRDARTPLTLFLALKDGPSPPTDKELNSYLGFLVSKKLYEFAYYVWLQFLPPDQFSSVGFLVNGSFEREPTGAPFDWTISSGQSVTIDIADRLDADGERALYLEFGPGRASFRGVGQLIVLSPGKYRLGGRLQGELAGRRGLQWRVACVATKQIVGETPMFLGAAPDWSDFAAEFEIPAENCRVQEIRLVHASRSASEELVSGAIWYDALKLVRLETADQG